MKRIKKTTLLSLLIAVFMGAFIGSANATDYYFFASTPGLIVGDSTYPFCEGEDCTYTNTSGASVSFNTAPEPFDIYLIGDSITPYSFTTSGAVDISVSSSNDSVLSDSAVSISGDTVEVGSFSGKGETQIVLTAKEDGQVVDQAFLNILVVAPSSAFITTWSVTAGQSITLPTRMGGYEYRGAINWGDVGAGAIDYSAFDSAEDSDFTHTFADAGEYTVTVDGTFEALRISGFPMSGLPAFPAQLKTVDNLGIIGWKSLEGAFGYPTGLTSFTAGNCDTSNVTNMAGMFDFANKLDYLDLNVTGFDTSNVTNMARMFYYANKLTTLDVTGFATLNVTDMSGMFSGTSALTSLDVSGFVTSNVTNMYGMFSSASALTSLSMNNWNTFRVNNMGAMFYGASSLVNLDIAGWNTSNVASMSSMFKNASSLTGLDLSLWDTSNITNIMTMFWGASSLTSLNVSNWNTSNITDVEYVFSELNSLTSLDLSDWNTSNIVDMSTLFRMSDALTNINLSGWDTTSVAHVNLMFASTDSMSTIIYTDAVSSAVYGKMLSMLANTGAVSPSGISFNRGANGCDTNTACDTANDYLRDTKSWTGMEAD